MALECPHCGAQVSRDQALAGVCPICDQGLIFDEEGKELLDNSEEIDLDDDTKKNKEDPDDKDTDFEELDENEEDEEDEGEN